MTDEKRTEPLEISGADKRVRKSIRDYVLSNIDEEQHGVIKHLYERWAEYNEKYFDGKMVTPIILLNEPSNPRRLGDCGPVSGFGCSSQIRIRPSLWYGSHPMMGNGNQSEKGKLRFLDDVLLHEMIHQYQQEVTGERDESYNGHGPSFSAKCNEVGEKLGLPRVGRTYYKRDTDEKGLPKPQYWPHHVHTDDYYLGAVHISMIEDEDAKKKAEKQEEKFKKLTANLVKKYGEADLRSVVELVSEMAGKRGAKAVERWIDEAADPTPGR